jgi:hypothetical protein
MRIIMLTTRRGSEDGFLMRRFLCGGHYDIALPLAVHFLHQGWAIKV